MSGRPPPGTPLCARADLTVTGAKSVLLTLGGARYDLFVVGWRGEVRAFVNACPHRGTPLETFDDRFFDAGGDHLVCSTHGALFDPANGLCVAGPCRGKMLEALPVRLENGVIVAA